VLLPDGDTLVSAEHSDGGGSALGLWSLSSTESRTGPRAGWQCHCLHLDDEHSILYAAHQRGIDIFTVSEDGRALTKTKRALPFGAHELRRHTDRIVHITEGAAWLFDLTGRTDAKVRPGHRSRTTGLGVSPDGERFATGSAEGVRVYDMQRGKLIAKMKPVHVFDIASRARIHDLALATKGAGVASMLLLPEHDLLAVGTDYGPVELHRRPG